MQWTNIVLWTISLAIVVSLIISVVTRRERSLIEVLRDLVTASNPPPANKAETGENPPPTTVNTPDNTADEAS